MLLEIVRPIVIIYFNRGKIYRTIINRYKYIYIYIKIIYIYDTNIYMHTCMERARWAPFLCRPLKKEKKEQKTRERKKKKGKMRGIQDSGWEWEIIIFIRERTTLLYYHKYIIYYIYYTIRNRAILYCYFVVNIYHRLFEELYYIPILQNNPSYLNE